MAHEIQENDSMFSVNHVPWHGLGIVLDHPPSIAEGLEKANLSWTVRLLPLFCQIPIYSNGRRTAGQFHEVDPRAVLREDTNEILGTVGTDYTPLQNSEAFSIFEPLIENKELLLETAGSLKNGRRTWILGRINISGEEISKGDEVRAYVLLSNSHDGTMAARFGFTPIRVVCNNTLTAAESENGAKLIRLIHIKGIHENLTVLRDIMSLSKQTFIASVEKYKFLASRDINTHDLERYIKICFDPEIEKALKLDPNIQMIMTPSQLKVKELFESGLGAGLPKSKTWWGAYNAVNEYLMYHRGRSSDSRLNSAWFGDGANLNRTALDKAMEMAQT